jgi:hypothetical protein
MRDEDVVVAYGLLSETLEMIEDSLLLVTQGLKMNPTVDERRDLDGQRHQLSIEKMKVVEVMKALGRGQLVIPRPTPDQVEAVQRLAREVDGLTRASVTASDTIVAAGQALAAVQKMQLS